LSAINDIGLFGILVALTAAFGTAALIVFEWCDARARQRGVIDRTTSY
jgi:hypothetical protein